MTFNEEDALKEFVEVVWSIIAYHNPPLCGPQEAMRLSRVYEILSGKSELGINPIPTRERCQMCHKISSVGFWVPNEVWLLAVHRHWQDSVLCLQCFVSQADEKLIEWEKQIKLYPVSLKTHLYHAGALAPESNPVDEEATE